MKTTNLEKLIKADLILQVQQQYSKSIIKQSDILDNRIRLFQKQLTDKKLNDVLQWNSLANPYNIVTLEVVDGIEKPVFHSSNQINGSHSEVRSQGQKQLISSFDYIYSQISGQERDLENHQKFINTWKKFLSQKNKYYKEYHLKDLLAGTNGELAATYNEQSIKYMLKNVNRLKNYLYSYNRMWKATLNRDAGYLCLFEKR